MSTLSWILISSFLMSCLALIGSLTLLFKRETLEKMLLPLVALAAGSLLGGAFFHMLPRVIELSVPPSKVFFYCIVGYCSFLALEHFFHWHHCHRLESPHECEETHHNHHSMTRLILLADGLHNLIEGIAIASAFIIDINLGITAWIAAAAHEIPQEFGDFAVLVHGGFSRKKALFFNFLSATTFIIGGLIAYSLSLKIDTSFLVSFAAGTFIYLATSDLVPELKKHDNPKQIFINFGFFLLGLASLLFLDHH